MKDLDFYLALKDGEEHSFYAQFNSIATLENCLVLFENDLPVACGAIKRYDENAMEIKRMFVKPEYRNRGFAKQILRELEVWAKELGYKETILETGIRQTEAVNLYEKIYTRIPNYGQYEFAENSVCFKKNIG